jgi:orotate phosphoribosyltransferase
VVNEKLMQKTVKKFGLFLMASNNGTAQEKLDDYFQSYYKLISSKKTYKTAYVDSFIKFYIEDKQNRMIFGDMKEKPEEIFPDLDSILTQPKSASIIAKKYKNKLEKARDEYGINTLCFIEKRKGPLGALLLQTYLTTELKISSFIYRAGYLDVNARVKGIKPKCNDKIAFVYDLASSGSGIQEPLDFIWKTYSSVGKYALVFLDYGREAKKRLAKHGLRLDSIYNKTEVIKKLGLSNG